jgi:hypothetical protein
MLRKFWRRLLNFPQQKFIAKIISNYIFSAVSDLYFLMKAAKTKFLLSLQCEGLYQRKFPLCFFCRQKIKR